MKIRLFIFCVIASICTCAFADVLAEADSAYNRKDYEQAIKLYRDAENAYGSSAQLLYNLGNAYYMHNEPANAVICYERALKLKPGNKQIKNNLEVIRLSVADKNMADLGGKLKKVDYDDATFTDAFYNWVAKGTASDIWALYAAIAFVFAMVCAAIYLFVKQVAARKLGFFLGLISLAFSAVFLLFSHWSEGYYNSSDEAVVTIIKTPLLSEPRTDAEPATTPINAGTKVEILKSLPENAESPEWYKIKLNQDFIGWIEAKDIEII